MVQTNPSLGRGALCRECLHDGGPCPADADLRVVTSGGQADDECCWAYKPSVLFCDAEVY